MKNIVFCSFLLAMGTASYAQTEPAESPKQATANEPQAKPGAVSVFTYVEKMPEFPGGQAALVDYLRENLKYPEEALDEEKEAKVYVKFIVDENGDIENVTSVRPVGFGMDDEAIRVVKSMPQWKPGMQSGKPVKVHFQLPIIFSMPKEAEEPKAEEPKLTEKKRVEPKQEKEPKEPKEGKEPKEKVSRGKKSKAKNEDDNVSEEKE